MIQATPHAIRASAHHYHCRPQCFGGSGGYPPRLADFRETGQSFPGLPKIRRFKLADVSGRAGNPAKFFPTSEGRCLHFERPTQAARDGLLGRRCCEMWSFCVELRREALSKKAPLKRVWGVSPAP